MKKLFAILMMCGLSLSALAQVSIDPEDSTGPTGQMAVFMYETAAPVTKTRDSLTFFSQRVNGQTFWGKNPQTMMYGLLNGKDTVYLYQESMIERKGDDANTLVITGVRILIQNGNQNMLFLYNPYSRATKPIFLVAQFSEGSVLSSVLEKKTTFGGIEKALSEMKFSWGGKTDMSLNEYHQMIMEILSSRFAYPTRYNWLLGESLEKVIQIGNYQANNGYYSQHSWWRTRNDPN